MDLLKNRKHELVWLAFKLEKDKIFMYKKNHKSKRTKLRLLFLKWNIRKYLFRFMVFWVFVNLQKKREKERKKELSFLEVF
jgi:hypothetical protein